MIARLFQRVAWYLTRPTMDGSSPTPRHQLRRLLRLSGWWYFHRLLGRGAVLSFAAYGFSLYLPASRGLPSLLYVLRDEYEPEMGFVWRFLRPGMVFVDVGANFGVYSLLAGRRVGDAGKVIAVEPVPATVEILRANVDQNQLSNIHIVQCAVADRDGKVRINIPLDDPWGSASLGHVEAKNSVTVELKTLDSIVASADVQRVDLIKVDVEGVEPLVIKGAERIIKTWKPILILEISHRRLTQAGFGPEYLENCLFEHGYQLYRYVNGNLISWRVQESSRSGNPDPNFIALHSSSDVVG